MLNAIMWLLSFGPNPIDLPHETRQLAIKADIITDKNFWSFTRDSQYFYDCLELMRIYEIVKDCPNSWDNTRFPDEKISEANLEFARKFLDKCETRVKMYANHSLESQELYEIITETKMCIRYWTLINSVTGTPSEVQYHRKKLKEYKDLVGDHMYYTGTLPPIVPYWRFARLD